MYVIISACNIPRLWYSDISKPRQCLQKSAETRKRAAVIGPSSLRKSPGGCIFVAGLRAAGLRTHHRDLQQRAHQATDHRSCLALVKTTTASLDMPWPLSIPLPVQPADSSSPKRVAHSSQLESLTPAPRTCSASDKHPCHKPLIASSPLHDPVKPHPTQSLGLSPDLSSAHLPMSGLQS